jgi:methylated-DNA-[protein]-cysteine S-methyltransferase
VTGELAWGRLESPLGILTVGVGEHGLARVLLPGEEAPATGPDDGCTDHARAELEAYFAGRLRRFTVPLDLPAGAGFRPRLLAELRRIPYGETITYGELAARAGNPRAARAAGHACATNPIPIVVPCHRVLGCDGSLRGYAGGPHRKRLLLRLEGALGPPA